MVYLGTGLQAGAEPGRRATVTHAPVIELFSAETTTSSNPYNLGVRASDYHGNELSIQNIRVYINGVEHEIDSTLHYYWYNLVLTEGENNVRVVVTDNEQYPAEEKTLH